MIQEKNIDLSGSKKEIIKYNLIVNLLSNFGLQNNDQKIKSFYERYSIPDLMMSHVILWMMI